MEQIIQLAETTGYFKPIDTISLVEEFNMKVAQTHQSHREESGRNQLTKTRNIYELYSDGEITWTEGSRSSHTEFPSILGLRKYPFKFVHKSGDYTSVVLPRVECQALRNEMLRLALLFTNSK